MKDTNEVINFTYQYNLDILEMTEEIKLKCIDFIQWFNWDDLIKCSLTLNEKLHVCRLIGGTLGLCWVLGTQASMLEWLSFNKKYVYFFYDIIDEAFH